MEAMTETQVFEKLQDIVAKQLTMKPEVIKVRKNLRTGLPEYLSSQIGGRTFSFPGF